MGPFTIDELVSAVNSVLRDRPDLTVTKRTIRFYVAQGIIPPPRGAPKFARYPFENLLTIVAIRRMQDRGEKLEVAQKLALRVHSSDVEEAIRWVESLGRDDNLRVAEDRLPYLQPPAPAPSVSLREGALFSRSIEPLNFSKPRRTAPLERYDLGPDMWLMVPAQRDQREVLEEVLEAIKEILRDFHDTT